MTDNDCVIGPIPPESARANLGLATTEELLREIVARLDDDETLAMRHVAYWCRSAADWGKRSTLEYRTVDSD